MSEDKTLEEFKARAQEAASKIRGLTPEKLEKLEAMKLAEEACTCKYCGRCVLAGSPCCYLKIKDLWIAADSEVRWLRKIQGKQAKRIHALQQELLKAQKAE